MDYLSVNGNYYGTGASSSGPNYQQSKVCTWFYDSDTYGDDKLFNQKQPYTKPGVGNASKVGIFDMHDNVTASWGIIGSPAQAIYTQAP